MSDAWAVLVALGAAAGAWWSAPVPVWVGAAVVVAAVARGTPVLLCVGVALFASALGARAWDGLAPPPRHAFAGVVTLVGDPEDRGRSVRVEVRAEGRRYEVWASGPAGWRLERRAAGDRVFVRGRIGPLPAAIRSRLAHRHVAGRLQVTEVGDAVPGGALARVANRAREVLVNGTSSLSPAERSLFAGFVLGDDRGRPPELTDDFRASGLSHLLVVSGQNVAFVLALAAPLTRRLGLVGRSLVCLAAIGAFGTMTRWEPSVLRAAGMAALAVTASSLGRPAPGLRLLALAVTALLLVDPLLIRSTSFALSVAASAGILLLARPLEAALPRPRVLARVLATTLAAQAGVAPMTIAMFGGLPVVSVPANLLAVPVAAPTMMWGLTGGALAGVLGEPAATALHGPTRLFVGWTAAVAHVGAQLPLGEVRLPHLVVAVGLGGLAVTAHRLDRRRAVRWAWLALAASLATPALAAAGARSVDARGTPLAGGGVLWRRAGTGGSTVLVVDAPDLERLLPALRRAGVRRVDVLVAIRASPSSIPALATLRRRLSPDDLLVPEGHGLGLDRARSPAVGTALTVGPDTLVVAKVRPRLELEVRERGPLSGPPSPAHGRSRGLPIGRVRSPGVELVLGPRHYDLRTRTLVMGILNRTPDSFYDKGSYWNFDEFVARAEAIILDGADILDVGGVKAGPGPEVSEAEELERVVPAIEVLAARFDVPLSVDTWRASVAKAAYGAGAVIGNDISGFADPDYLPVAAAAGAAVVATHIRLRPRIPDPEPHYDDVVAAVGEFLAERARRAEAAGIPRERIMVDAGLDLGKTWQQSLELLRASDRLAGLGYPVLLSASNKTFLGRLLELEVDQRREATMAAHAVGVALGCRILRAHDVRGARRVADVVGAILAGR